ncbi:MAG: hypothetical protein PWQ68_1623 [Thermoanaerobacteraceae bacterium]|nr:hypothetical protein [Thermoanaerobacteraceae bacterium]
MAEIDPILQELKEIIEKKSVRTVFQPIISMKTGEILGYEALSRGPKGSPLESPLELFAAAEKYHMLFALERVCREKALMNAGNIKNGYKIFININPYVIYDPEFKGGVTRSLMESLNFAQKDVVIELTERASIQDFKGFRSALEHYTEQGYKIAIDDTGAGYSGLQSIVSITYNYIKIDRSLIENIDKDPVKQALLDAFIKFAKRIESMVIAEGIETLEEMETLIDLGVDYGQGYIIARPSENFTYEFPIVEYIHRKNNRKKHYSSDPTIRQIAQRGIVVSPDTLTSVVAKMFEKNDSLNAIVVLEGVKPIGLVMREKLYSRLGTQFGYAVFMGRPIKLVMDKSPLIVETDCPLSEVSQKAMERNLANIYDCIIVTKNGDYFGIVTIRNLLDKFTKLQIEQAKNLNPLTNLPGNPVIEKQITDRLEAKEIFSVLYIDIDNFKPYNDRYGYKKGDEVIKFTADVLKKVVNEQGGEEDFIGHIGGDDFVIVTSPEKDELISKNIIERFDSGILQFYSEEDKKKGYIITKDRQGYLTQKPLSSISIAIVSNKNRRLENHLQISEIAAELKEYAKNQQGSTFVKDKRKDCHI